MLLSLLFWLRFPFLKWVYEKSAYAKPDYVAYIVLCVSPHFDPIIPSILFDLGPRAISTKEMEHNVEEFGDLPAVEKANYGPSRLKLPWMSAVDVSMMLKYQQYLKLRSGQEW